MAGRETGLAALWVKEHADRWTTAPEISELDEMLRRLARWRASLLVNTFVARHGQVVLQGPFAGMEYVREATEGALLPRLLGAYESELHPYLEGFAREGVDCIIDVGCAEGYYAVGLARMIGGATVHAFDTDPAAQTACAELAERNGVAQRVIVGGAFAPTDFERFAGRNALVIMDVEGAEDELLRPDLAPALGGMRLIVETHELYSPGVIGRLLERFQPTHRIAPVFHQPKTQGLPRWLLELSELDRLLAVWEWRRRPTPWLVMTPRQSS